MHKRKPHPDPKDGHKVTGGRTTHHSRGKGKLAPKIKGNDVKEFKHNARDKFRQRAKAPAPDNVGRKMRPTAHAPVEEAKAKKRRALIKKYSDQVI